MGSCVARAAAEIYPHKNLVVTHLLKADGSVFTARGDSDLRPNASRAIH